MEVFPPPPPYVTAVPLFLTGMDFEEDLPLEELEEDDLLEPEELLLDAAPCPPPFLRSRLDVGLNAAAMASSSSYGSSLEA